MLDSYKMKLLLAIVDLYNGLLSGEETDVICINVFIKISAEGNIVQCSANHTVEEKIEITEKVFRYIGFQHFKPS